MEKTSHPMTTDTVTADQYRAQLLEQLEADNVYGFCASVTPYLSARPEDTYVRLLAVRSYLKLHLIEPARALIDNGLGGESDSVQLLEARASLGALPGSRQDWANRTARFEANLAALAGRGFDVTPIRGAWGNDRSRYELYRDSAGEFQVRYRPAAGDWRWYPGLGRHSVADENRPLPEDIGSTFPGPYLFEGLGLGHYFERLYNRTLGSFLDYSCALYVVERDPSRLAVVFHLHDWSRILADPRVMVFVDGEAIGALVKTLKSDPCLPLPVRILQTGAVFDAAERIAAAASARRQAVSRSLATIEARYADRDVGFWARRFDGALRGTDPPLRILAAVSRHTTFLKYSMRDARRAFESLGHTCTVLTEDADHTTIAPQHYHRVIRERDIDLFFNIDHLRPEFGAIIPANLPVLTWDQDQLPHVITKENLAGIARHDFVAGCSKPRCAMLGANPSQLLHARVPTCPRQFTGEPLSPQESERFTCDVSYVSHASLTPRSFHEQERSRWADPASAAFLDALCQLVPPAVKRYAVLDGFRMAALIARALAQCGLTSLDPAFEGWLRNWYIWRLADRVFRHQALEWVGQWARRRGRAFRIYGHGWAEHPTLADFAVGPVENGRELLCVYRASRINLQLMPAGFIHQRALDGLAAGGFFMTRLVPHDLCGAHFEALDRRMRELRIDDDDALRASSDAVIRRHLDALLTDVADRGRLAGFELVAWIRSAAELSHPDQVFDDYRDIAFDSPEQFAGRADSFLQDPGRRERIAQRMRRVVVNRFSYEVTMARFLEAMRDHLCREAARP